MSILKECHGVAVWSVLCFGIFCLVWVWLQIWKKSSRSFAPTNWPVLGMVPAIIHNAHRFHEYATELLRHNGGTIEIKGPWFANTFMLLTCDPANINHILCKNFNNYPKGPHFHKIFEILGDGIINTDSHLWELHRKTTMPLMNHPNFRASLERNVLQKMEKGLFPALDRYAQLGACFDLQQVFQRMGFDISCQQFLDKDPGNLCIGGGDHPVRKAIRDAVNAILYRNLLPERCWKVQNWFGGIDREKNLTQAWEAIDQFIYPILLERTDELNKNQQLHEEEEEEDSSFSMLTSHIEAHKGKSMKFLRDTFLTLIVAGGDTTASALTWFFYLLAKNPLVQSNILEEILQLKQNLVKQQDRVVFKVEECQKLVYLHAAFCESLRLFPSIPFNHKIPMEKDVLPSGHVVTPNTKIIIPFYSMGRIEAIWGEDCMEFKPERWISHNNGGIKHHPSYKFPAFNAGPRTCIGKEMAFIVVKMVAANLICHYQWQLVEPHHLPILITDSILFEKKHGLMIKLNKRK